MHTKLVLAALAVICVATPAMAEDCKQIQLLNSVAMTPYGDTDIMMVPVNLNGAPKKMVLATEGAVAQVYPATATALNLPTEEAGGRLLSGNGNASSRVAHLETVQIGRMVAKGVNMMIAPDSKALNDGISDGVFSGDMLERYDIEMDFAARKLNFFSPDHCPDKVIYWPAQVIAVVPFTQLRPVRQPTGFGGLQSQDDTHIRVPVTIDGKPFMATISTAATVSTMDAGIASTVFNVTPDESQKNVHIFDTLTFDGVTVTHPHIVLHRSRMGDNDPENGLATGSRTRRVDAGLDSEVTIGMDVLKHLHLYIAYRARKLYITPASAPAPAAPTKP